ncbi:MAG: hypothetical protein IOC58_13415 [Methylobacterium sp.]|nr:hypothetical protein [Methylobacterium sp.]
MRIDWTQTLLGQDDRNAAAALRSENAEARAWSTALAGRMAGLLGAVVFLALVLVLAPLRPELGLRVDHLIALSGLLVFQVVAFALMRQGPRPALLLFGPISAVQILLLAGLGSPGAALVCAILLATAEFFGLCLLFQGRNRIALILFAAGLGAAAAGLILASGHGPTVLMLIGMAVPTLTMLALAPTQSPLLDALEPAPRGIPLGKEPFREHRGLVLAVDSTGLLASELERARFGWLASAAEWPYPSVIDAVLVIDRPALLQALSRAIHLGEATPKLALRLRQDSTQGGGRFVERELSVAPAPGLPGLALVALGQEVGSLPAAPAAEPRASADPSLVQRAMHDAVAPFNASLGYLELIADPKLAPRDLASYRHYAGEARGAMLEAHRNTALMGRWLKLLAGPAAPVRERVEMVRLAQDALRFILAAEGGEGAVSLTGEPAEAPAELPADAARFAIGVMLRGALQDHPGAALEMSVATIGADVQVVLRRADGGSLAGGREDMFQMALEQAATGASRAVFTADSGQRRVNFRGVATAAKPARHLEQPRPRASGRLAS